MSSGCGDVLSLQDLKTAKLHQTFEAEVITGKAGGVASGADIDYATNPVTGQTQKTLPAILRDVGYTPASFTFATGGTLAAGDRQVAVLWPLSSGGDGDYYYWEGALPKTIPSSSTPATTGGVGAGAWRPVGDLALRSNIASSIGYSFIGEVSNFATLRSLTPPYSGARVKLRSWSGSNIKGGGDFIGYLTAKADDGGMTASSGAGFHWERQASSADVFMFGAAGDGATDDTLRVQAAVDWGAANRKTVKFPTGTFMVDQIVVKAHTYLVGEGRGSVIKRRAVNGLDLIYGVNSNALWDSTDPNVTNFAYDVELSSLLLDGGVDGAVVAFTPSMVGDGIAIWGHNFRWHNLDLLNMANRGIRTQATDTNVDFASTWQESSFDSIRVRNTGGHCWQFYGPHDSKFVDISLINGSQKADNTYDGMITGGQGTGDFSGLHISVSGNNTNNFESLRHRYSLNLNTPCRFSGGTSIEGARIPLRMACSGSQFDSSCTYYAAWGSGADAIAIKMEGGCSLNILRGLINGSEAFRTGFNQYGVVMGVAAGDSVNNNTIDLTINGCNIPISFGSSTTTADGDKGNNSIKVKAYYNGVKTPVGTYGVLNSANGSTIDMELTGVSPQILNSLRQNRTFSLAAGASASWTFKYPFASAPVVSTAIVGPGGTPTNGVWVSTLNATSATIFNGTGTTITLHASATRQVAI